MQTNEEIELDENQGGTPTQEADLLHEGLNSFGDHQAVAKCSNSHDLKILVRQALQQRTSDLVGLEGSQTTWCRCKDRF
jgi:hypothetical protein